MSRASCLGFAAAAVSIVLSAGPALPAPKPTPKTMPKPMAVQVVQPWSRPAAAGASGVGYMALVNRSAAAAVLVKVESPLARRVEMHRSSLNGAVMSMTPQARIDIPPGATVTFGPGGNHLMFVALTQALKPGDRLPATLSFADGRRLRVRFAVGTGAGPPNGRNS